MEYKIYLKSNKWKSQKRKATYWHGNKCAICGSKKIEIHHKTYGNGLGNENPKYHLIPLCRLHHQSVHDLVKNEKINIYEATIKILNLKKKNKKKTWKNMTPFERAKYLGDI